MRRISAAALLLVLAGCSRGPEPFRVGSKPFTESEIVGEIVAQLAEADGALVERRFFLGGTICFEALKKGDLDAYVEYTGTGLVNLLGEPPRSDPAEVYRRVKDEFQRRWGLVWAAPLGFDNSYALVVRADRAGSERLSRISDLKRVKPLICGFDLEFADRMDGWRGLKAAYGLEVCAQTRQMNSGLLYDALAAGRVDLISGYTTDGRIKTLSLAPLLDDRGFFPPYQAAPLLGPRASAKAPKLAARLAALAGKLTDEEMRGLNALVDSGKKSARDAAREFLIRRGLL